MSIPENRPLLHILLAIDGPEQAHAAVQMLYHLPLSPESQVMVAGVLAACHKSGQEVLSASISETQILLKDKVRTTIKLLRGHPAKALTDFARMHQPDLIMVGTNGLQAILGRLLGGVAQQVVEVASRPVLVVRPPCRRLRRVLLVIGNSLPRRVALSYMTRFPFPANTEIQVMHVLPPRYASIAYPFAYPTGSDGLPPPIITKKAVELMEQEITSKENESRATLEQVVKTLRLAGKKATSILAHGDAATEIMEYSRTHAIDLIVTGSRGLGQVEGWLRGSVSRRLIHSAGCSVLVVRDKTNLG